MKEDRYTEALNTAKMWYRNTAMPDNVKEIFRRIFPELKENEDERIRKELIDAVQGLWNDDALPMPLSVKRKNEWLAWLEKQGETSPILSNSSNIVKNWNEEDEKRVKNILSVLDVQVCWDGATMKKMNPYQKEIDWVKSLRPQSTWKPQGKSAPEAINESQSFKPGDWVIRKNGATFSNGSICARVRNIEGHKVWFEHGTYADEAYLVKIKEPKYE